MKISFISFAPLASLFVSVAFSAANPQKPTEQQLVKACGPITTQSDAESLDTVTAYFSQSGITAINRALDNHQRTCLHLAACAGKVRVIDYLRSIGANPNGSDLKGYVPLHYAVLSSQMKAVEALLKFPSVRVQVENVHGKTPIDYATSVGNKAMVGLLRSFLGKSPYILPEEITKEVLFQAIRTNDEGEERNFAVVQKFFEKAGFSRISNPIDAVSRKTLLHLAVIHRKTSIVEYLCANGANPEAPDADARTPLSLAKLFGYQAMVDILTSRCQNVPTVAQSVTQAVPDVPQSAQPEATQVSPRQRLIEDAKAAAISASASLRSGKYNEASEQLHNALKIIQKL